VAQVTRLRLTLACPVALLALHLYELACLIAGGDYHERRYG